MHRLKLKNPIGYYISNMGRSISHQLTLLFQPYDVTSEQWSIMFCLIGEEGMTHKELASRTEKDRANVTRLVDQLERKGLVKRVNNPEDRRSIFLHLTEEGKKIVQALIPIEQAFIRNLLKGVSEEELEQFTATIHKLNENVNRHVQLN